MGVPLFKNVCTINNDILLSKLNEIEQSNSELNFFVSKTVNSELINSFLIQQELLKNHLRDTYGEEIEEYTFEYLNGLNNGVASVFEKGFALIADNRNNIIGRLDYTKETTTIRLETLYVSNDYRGKKLGLWLVGKLMLFCKNEFDNIKLFETNTDENNDSALKILKSYNFYVKYTIEQLIQNRK